MYRIQTTGFAMGLLSLLFLVITNAISAEHKAPDQRVDDVADMLTVYKSPTCGCCKKWMDHLEAEGFEVKTEHPPHLDVIKVRYRIATELRSCHTAVSSHGFVFEGHIPAQYVRQFLANPPANSIGLTVPEMPVGSPGMETGGKFTPYKVLMMKKDGKTEVFVNVESASQQYQRSKPARVPP